MNISTTFCQFATFVSAFVSPVAVKSEDKLSQVMMIESLSQIPLVQPQKTLFLFDIDDTLFDTPYMLGSKAWRRYIVEATKKIYGTKNWHDILSLFLAQNYQLRTVEPMTAQFVKELQNRGYVVCGFTSRERNLWYDMPRMGIDNLTTTQLNSLNIDFDNRRLENTYPYLALDSEYYKGTFFANIEPKGNFLLHLLKNAPELPAKVVFVDDKLSQVDSVASALSELKIKNECYCYVATEKKAKAFDPLIANIQLYSFYHSHAVLTDEQAAAIAKESPTLDADYYLRAVLNTCKIPDL